MRSGSESEKTPGSGFQVGTQRKNFRVLGWNPEYFLSSGLEPGNFSGFRVGTRKFFWVPGWNPEIFPGSGLELEIFPGWNPEPGNSKFRVPEIFGLFPGFSALFSNPEKS